MPLPKKHGDTDLNYFTCTLGEAAEQPRTNFTTVNKLIDIQERYHAQKLACGFPSPQDRENSWKSDLFTYEDLRKGSIAAAEELISLFQGSNIRKRAKCIGLLCPSSVDFLFTWLGLMRAGFAVLLIAPQCQPEAIVHLCQSCDAPALVYDQAYSKLASSAVLRSENIIAHQIPWQSQHLNIRDLLETPKPFGDRPEADETDVAYIHHTSGTSSGLPKAIPQTHQGGIGVLPCLDGADVATFTTTPLYHGGVADCFRAWASNALIWLFPGNICPITTKNVLECIKVADSVVKTSPTAAPVKYFSSVPYVLQMLAEDPAGTHMLQRMDIVGVGGAALPLIVGDKLVSQGVQLVSRFGSAECGFLMCSNRDYGADNDWQYLRVPKANTKYLNFEPQPGDSGLHELIVLPHWPHIARRNREDGSFATSDLFEAHPTLPNAWRYHGRSDSQITLLTGKKFDPAPIEDEIASKSHCIREVLIFGNGKQVPGALVFLAINKNGSKESVHNEIWDVVQAVNMKGQDHTRIANENLMFLDPDTPPLSRSSKGTLLRATAENRFSKEIEGAYGNFDTKDDIQGLFDYGDLKPFVREIINNFLGQPLASDHVDFYQAGLDSTQSTRIKSVLQKRLVNNGKQLPWNVVYDCGNIEVLSQYIFNIREGRENEASTPEQEMMEMAKRYSVLETAETCHNDRICLNDGGDSKVVLLTGATGALGAHILDILRRDCSVSEVFCLVRVHDHIAAQSRVSGSFEKRRKPPLSDNDSITCLSASLGLPDLGIMPDVLSSLQSKVTHIIHAAWTVNFSLPLRSFENDNIAGLQNILNFAKSCHNRSQVVFCSSTASVLGKQHPTRITETISELPSDADTLGYSQSKWVAEAICSAAWRGAMMGRVKILRIGQLTGDTENGVWNMNEAWPLMLSTIHPLGCLPERQDKLAWLPMDTAAQAVVDIGLNSLSCEISEDSCPVFHVVNNSTDVSWKDLLGWVREIRLKPFDVVESGVWMDRLDELESHPAKSLLWLWRRGDEQRETESGGEQVLFETANAEKMSESMRSLRPFDKELGEKIWRWLEGDLR